jgi:hypothetical protein
MEAWAGIEPANRAFAEPCLTTWLPRPEKNQAADNSEDYRRRKGLFNQIENQVTGISSVRLAGWCCIGDAGLEPCREPRRADVHDSAPRSGAFSTDCGRLRS